MKTADLYNHQPRRRKYTKRTCWDHLLSHNRNMPAHIPAHVASRRPEARGVSFSHTSKSLRIIRTLHKNSSMSKITNVRPQRHRSSFLPRKVVRLSVCLFVLTITQVPFSHHCNATEERSAPLPTSGCMFVALGILSTLTSPSFGLSFCN
jgi:hypothetical protein